MIRVVLDTDIGNEIDDMFALMYLLSSKELELKALTIEPFSKSVLYPEVSPMQSIKISLDVSLEMLDLAGRRDLHESVFVGADRYYFEDRSQTNDAVEGMIKILKEFPDTVIASTGAPVNVALLFQIYPEFADRTKVVWLGGNDLGYRTNVEYNFSQDLEAVKKVFSSCKNLTVIPCKNIASNLSCSEAEIKQYFSGSYLGDYLIYQYEKLKHIVCHEKTMMGYAKTLWDISVIAYLINNNWFEIEKRIGVGIDENQMYCFNNGDNTVEFAVGVNRNSVMNDFFTKTVSLCFAEHK